MVLEAHVVMFLTEPDFLGGGNCPKNGENGLKMDLLENLVINFF